MAREHIEQQKIKPRQIITKSKVINSNIQKRFDQLFKFNKQQTGAQFERSIKLGQENQFDFV